MRYCQRCRTRVPVERVQAIPETHLCWACSEAVKGDFEVYLVKTSLGKAGSVKKNYGDYHIVKRRRRIEPLPW